MLQKNLNGKMILLENSVLRLDYTPATDVAIAVYPDLHDYLFPEIKYSIDRMVKIIRNYDIKNLLLDSTKTTSSVDNNLSMEIATYLVVGLSKTRIKKVANVQALHLNEDTTLEGNIRHVNQITTLPFDLLIFKSKGPAIEWLESK